MNALSLRNGSRDVGSPLVRAAGDCRVQWPTPAAADRQVSATTGNVRHRAEDLVLAGVAAAHMLEYLQLCAIHGVSVLSYVDEPAMLWGHEPGDAWQAIGAVLEPVVVVRGNAMRSRAEALHDDAQRRSPILQSVDFRIDCRPTVNSLFGIHQQASGDADGLT